MSPKMENEDKRILLVDDDPESIKIMKTTLNWEGYSVEMARSGQVAIDKMCSWCPHLVLLDINMPGLEWNRNSQISKGQCRACLYHFCIRRIGYTSCHSRFGCWRG